ncbi:exodeoxyribonuclease III [Ostreibacterium oceani]|uniref:Exodeoxyribonuclease III n=1 Tax=Ostreibacterium oceani TaxID=2654998 RepID=A0A6N7EXA6_9GAMM|nr:exodeoxyribonuclease III [Ostreibacterium oceani]MPV86215.1 exodeoxyribonuclease III [Ostreibacterium oceani]
MKVVSINTNGIRAAARKGFFSWLRAEDPDVVCIQETKAQVDQLTDDCFWPQGYHCVYHDAVKKGYSGVAIYAKVKPQQVTQGIGWPDIDAEGRYLEFTFQNASIISLYMHSGSSGDARQLIKEDFMARFYAYLMARKTVDVPIILCGDINIVHTEKDIKNAKGNQKNSGFLPHERAWIDRLFREGFCDAFRLVDDRAEQYTWWSNRGQAWAKNVGWRIDYQIISACLAPTVKSAMIYKDERFSDHAPLVMTYDFALT